ncbi:MULTISPECIES: MaoC/PaaZ C-terminal domain-containing protein [Sorangium]|uniref:MaoC family dehydratase n=1 Tax=Sorangium cellulosum TaxID=56 RepID=A0A4P2R608_SORCE|nr:MULTISPECIES: MaoC/PaaZ C-terminal domain-containing protein [Sorangium]AUX38580.1 MaoC family dehydratase [Sorangium cellulosum]WCQ97865.1 Bifunctional protein PaaZ [Sorangium sp. Soce836]
MFDRWYDELRIGDRRSFRGVTITEAHIVGFAGVTGDHYPLHVDAEYARATRYGQRIAHGFLVISCSAGLFPMEDQRIVAFYGMDAVRFCAPTFIGDTIHPDMEVVAKRDKDPGGVVSVRNEIINQRGELVCTSILHILAARRPTPMTSR